MKVITIFGTRPEAIKLLPVVQALKAHPDFEPIVCVTAQHRDMLDQVLSVFNVKPDIDLNIMRANQDLFDVTAHCLLKLREVLKAAQPDLVLVQGDTTTCFVSALAAFYLKIPVAHVEAGLRTYNLKAPFPEEGNRSLVARIADLHFAPTKKSEAHLLQEKITPESVLVTGNTVIDTLLKIKEHVLQNDDVLNSLPETVQKTIRENQPYVLITGHRRENFGAHLEEICQALRTLANRYPHWQWIYPVHLNPNVKAPVTKLLKDCPNIQLLPPLDYFKFVYAMLHAKLIITDSGGIQEEAPSLGKPVLITRDTTERMEAVSAGAAILVGHSAARIVTEVERLMHDPDHYVRMSRVKNPYGDGNASRYIVEALARYFCKRVSSNVV